MKQFFLYMYFEYFLYFNLFLSLFETLILDLIHLLSIKCYIINNPTLINLLLNKSLLFLLIEIKLGFWFHWFISSISILFDNWIFPLSLEEWLFSNLLVKKFWAVQLLSVNFISILKFHKFLEVNFKFLFIITLFISDDKSFRLGVYFSIYLLIFLKRFVNLTQLFCNFLIYMENYRKIYLTIFF